MIGKRLSSLAIVLNRQDIEVYVCEQLLDEIQKVISRPKFDKLISKETGVPVILAEAPLDCVAIGAGKSFELEREISSDRSIYDMLNS